jgi:hypothetical protein
MQMSDEAEEKKKWHIDRIERTLETIIKQLESERAQNKSEADVIENRFTNWRNSILTASSFAAPLILGLYSADILKEFMLPVLIVDVFFGILTFIVFTLIKGKIQAHILSMDTSYFHALNALNRLALYIVDETVSIDENDRDKLWWFVILARFAEKTVRAIYVNSLQDISRSRFFKRTSFSEQSERLLKKMDEGFAIYGKDPTFFDVYPSDLKVMKSAYQNFFERYDRTIDERGMIVFRVNLNLLISWLEHAKEESS